jgi:hypothetical protein
MTSSAGVSVQSKCGTVWDDNKYDIADSYDLVGDSYNADNTAASYQPVPQPDSNALDCAGEGHGTHTAGIAAGYGVKADGTTYTGAYDSSTESTSTTADWKIGPGMAPLATLISFRVFGCAGSSDEITHALDMAIDLNTDANPSNNVNVINMSLGADYAPADDADAEAADAAVDAGINVVVASGNDDDVPDIGGSPGDAPQVLTVAASQDAAETDDGLHYTIAGGAAQVGAASRSLGYDYGSTAYTNGTHGDLAGAVALAKDSTGALITGCTPLTTDEAAEVTGKIAAFSWDDFSPACGSKTIGADARTAGAIGFILLSNRAYLSAGINGDFGADGLADSAATGHDAIPGVLLLKTPADAIVAALNSNEDVEVSGTSAADTTAVDDDLNNSLADFSSRGVGAAGNVKPDVAAVGTTVTSAHVGTGDEGISYSGTSMATPMTAGLAALVVGLHPNWTPEQVKADIMNTAGADVKEYGDDGQLDGGDPSGAGANPTYAPNRVGSGRIDAEAAVSNDVLAYNADDKGTVSVSFGPVAVPVDTTNFAATKTIKVTNTGTTEATYDVAYNPITSIPGVDYTLSTSSVDLQPGATARVVVTLTVPDPTVMDKSIDPTYWDRDADGNVVDTDGIPLETLADASGLVEMTPSGTTTGPDLRVPVYSAPRPASDLSVGAGVTLKANGTGTLTPVGAGLAQGTTDSDPSNDIYSIGAGFELQATSGPQPSCSASVTANCLALPDDSQADIKYVGSGSDYPTYPTKKSAEANGLAYFAISTWGTHASPAGDYQYDVYLDLNGDGVPDVALYNTAYGYPDTAEPFYVTDAVDLNDPSNTDVELTDGRFGSTDLAAFNSDVMVLPAWIPFLESAGLKSGDRISYGVTAYGDAGVVDSVGMDPNTGDLRGALSMDPFAPGLQVTEQGSGPLVDDQDAVPLDVTKDAASYAADDGLGLMFVHFHNQAGSTAQIVKLGTAAKVASDLTIKPADKTVKKGKAVKVDVAFKTVGGVAPTGKITLEADGKSVGSAYVKDGTASFSFKAKSVGKVKLTASYPGDAEYNPGSAKAVTITVK